MKLEKGIEVECIDLSSEGKGVVKYNNKTGFIDSLLVGEKAIVDITYQQKDIFFGKVKKLITISPYRVNPKCPIHSSCGGCALWHLSYEEQLKFKQKKVSECLKRIGKLNISVDETVGMEDPYHYRNKIQMPIRLDKKKNIVSGFYKEKTHELMPVKECFIENKKADIILNTIKELMKTHRIAPYDEDKRSGVIRHVLIRTSYYFDEVMVVLITNCDEFKGRNNLVQDIKKAHSNVKTIVQIINTRATNVILGERQRILFGKGYIVDKLGGLEFHISARSFYQINSLQTEKLYKCAIDKANLTGKEYVLDSYCGIGTIGLIAASKAKKVVGVEIVKDAIKDARKNAIQNNIQNAEFYCQDASIFIEERNQEGEKFDVVFMDPPRKGADTEFLNTLLKVLPQKIVYISCDPATLSRDLAILSKKYKIESATPFDLFPFTYHVESVVLLIKK